MVWNGFLGVKDYDLDFFKREERVDLPGESSDESTPRRNVEYIVYRPENNYHECENYQRDAITSPILELNLVRNRVLDYAGNFVLKKSHL